ncbi:MAG: LacI family transcriptional regulator [Hyphomonas sp.]|uniref:glycoside hydrolase family 9 protein n=1 Tax=Hyphomonas sp. TaxID=87 RepID=UPI0017C41DBA|nr:glycoside hydrolase family 9 protein [Hyphomonas sp.]MBA3067084.1 LacI family transcriptional regulator [Hyphomonas sp.]MBU3920257.1 glycoside hydrolase family 9 protein [Alphaproteobacteria bacterium]MBU4063120.1 glycoside hydrolase family 9 protein [Alphaproteobacteria bacterium]MBU4164437.1 glycoside hydrolase family 9 protein [Alphaproteobacteria bacterium]
MRQRAATGWAALCLAGLAAACSGSKDKPADPPPRPADAVPALPIVLDQFGYRPDDPKIIRIRQPTKGYDTAWSQLPRLTYYVRRADTDAPVKSFALDAKEDVPVDELSGDQIWQLDVSRITEPGEYVITSGDGAQVSGAFSVSKDVYKPILREAFRTFYYQRAGYAKSAPQAGAGWTDTASHLGPGQDSEARLYSAPGDARTARDLRGGWFDAGDYNQYTNWTADQCRTLLISYRENPGAWGDDFGIPESGNSVPDILDEVSWGLDWLLRMQNPDGSVLSILGRDAASPPSAAKGPSRYGPASTSATLSAAGTFALAAIVFQDSAAPGHADYAARLKAAALAAWAWADAHPDVTFQNNDAASRSEGLGAGQQEADSEYLNGKRFAAAAYLTALTSSAEFLPTMDAALAATSLMQNGQVDAYRYEAQDAALFLARQPASPPELQAYLAKAFQGRLTPQPVEGYSVPVDALHWGSNSVMARTGVIHLDAARLSGDAAIAAGYTARALDYLHYLHGANPMGKVYLTNMGAFGAESSVGEFYHSWKTETPIPGFLVGGPNPTYDWDACCPDKCGGGPSNAACGTARLSPPYGQPPLKSYLDFDDGWPLNSWQISENSNAYQAAYLRLLANFVD